MASPKKPVKKLPPKPVVAVAKPKPKPRSKPRGKPSKMSKC